jgi:hypothetical protein
MKTVLFTFVLWLILSTVDVTAATTGKPKVSKKEIKDVSDVVDKLSKPSANVLGGGALMAILGAAGITLSSLSCVSSKNNINDQKSWRS